MKMIVTVEMEIEFDKNAMPNEVIKHEIETDFSESTKNIVYDLENSISICDKATILSIRLAK